MASSGSMASHLLLGCQLLSEKIRSSRSWTWLVRITLSRSFLFQLFIVYQRKCKITSEGFHNSYRFCLKFCSNAQIRGVSCRKRPGQIHLYRSRNSSRQRPLPMMYAAAPCRRSGSARLIHDAGDVLLVGGIAQDEAVVRAVGVQPFKFRRVFKIRRQALCFEYQSAETISAARPVLCSEVPGRATHMAACFSASSRLKPPP